MTDRPRRPTPRPTFDGACVIKADSTVNHLWGDPDGSRFVSDRIYVSSSGLHVLQYTLPPRGSFLHSPKNPTVFAGDVSYVVLSGRLILVDVESGEVRPLRAGDIGFFRRDTWHQAFNPSDEPVVVLEYFAPPPSRGTASPYALAQPYLQRAIYEDSGWETRWPADKEQWEKGARINVVTEGDYRYSLPGADGGHLQGIAVDTEYLRVRRGYISPAYQGDEMVADLESLLYVTSGVLHVHLPDAEGPAWHRLTANDAVYLPVGAMYRLIEMDGSEVTYWLGSGRLVDENWKP